MKLRNIRKAFTLIELLVVITIIGILATGATSVYTSQIQKARDTTRINDVKALQSSVEQVYQDSGEYPHADSFFTEVSLYLEKLPSDPKHAQPCNDGGTVANQPECAYAYKTQSDTNGIDYGVYEVSTSFENEGNVTKKAGVDGGGAGVELARFELGINTDTVLTPIAKDAITTVNGGACLVGGTASSDGISVVVINGNPSSGECG